MSYSTKYALLGCLCWGIVFYQCHDTSSLPDKTPENLIKEFLDEHQVAGMFIAVVKGDSVLFQKSVGYDGNGNITPNTCMELGSISKAFTAEAIYLLASEGKLGLNDPVTKYLTGAPKSWSVITIKHLLKHTSGIRNYLQDPRFKTREYFEGITVDESALRDFFYNTSTDSMLGMFYSLPIEFSPGNSWAYSNTGYYLLGKIAEAAAGIDFFDYVKNRVTDPIGMMQTRANESAAEEGCLSKGYREEKGSLKTLPYTLHSHYAFSAGAWATTGSDMISYMRAVHQKRLPSDKAGYDWRNIRDSIDLPFTYEGGRFHSYFNGLKLVTHNGGTAGFSSSWYYVVPKNISIIVLMNRQDYAPIEKLAWDLLSCYEPSLQYPQVVIKSEEENFYKNKLIEIVKSIETGSSLPEGLSKPLGIFLNSENGRGLWSWFFHAGIPGEATCVGREKNQDHTAYRFALPGQGGTSYRLTLVINANREITQLRWW